jgi:hypothetical protein
MTRARLLTAVALAAGLFAVVGGSTAQPPGGRPGNAPGQPGGPGAVGAQPGREAALPLVPPSASVFMTLKVSDLAAHPDLKPVFTELAKQPDALAGIIEAIGVSPLALDRITLFWPRWTPRAGGAGVLVVTTREPYNEARVLKTLRADPVYDGDAYPGRGGSKWSPGGRKPAPKSAEPSQIPRQNLDPFDPPAPGVPGLKDPPKVPPVSVPGPPEKKRAGEKLPPPPKHDDSCGGGSADGGPGDPLFYAIERGPFEVLFLIDDRTLVFLANDSDRDFAHLALLAATLKKSASGPLADAIRAAGQHTLAAGVHLTPVFREIDRHRKPPPELVPYTALLAARTAVLTGDLGKSARFELVLTFDDATAAKRAAPVLEEGIATVAEHVGEGLDRLKERQRLIDKATVPLAQAFVSGLKKATVKADGATVTARTEIDAGPVVAKALGDVLQAVQSRKKFQARTNNLKQIGLALHSYHDVNGKFPTNVYGPKGEPLLSWRVHLLPYLEEEALYRQFRMDQAWDGPNNKALIEKMPKALLTLDRETAQGKTFYQAFSGPDPASPKQPKGVFGRPWLRDGDRNGIRFTDIVDGTSNTIAVIEAREGVIWSKPEDLPFGGPVPLIGEKGAEGALALFFDGHVSLLPTSLKADEFWAFITINGGEVTVDLDPDGRSGGIPGFPDNERPAGAARRAATELRVSDVRELEEQVARAERELRDAERHAAAALDQAEEAARAFAGGKATAEQVAKARAVADAAKQFSQVRRQELEQERERLRAAKAALEKAKGGRPEK